jgi:hypothetical protein
MTATVEIAHSGVLGMAAFNQGLLGGCCPCPIGYGSGHRDSAEGVPKRAWEQRGVHGIRCWSGIALGGLHRIYRQRGSRIFGVGHRTSPRSFTDCCFRARGHDQVLHLMIQTCQEPAIGHLQLLGTLGCDTTINPALSITHGIGS